MEVLSDYSSNKNQLQMFRLHRLKRNNLIYKEDAIYKLFTCLSELRLNTVFQNIWGFEIKHRF
jgi:hypothetical protein